jgi:gliding motility-associated protein GldC
VPESFDWNASDTEGERSANCKAMILSMWDPEKQDTLRLDLWTKEMKIDEMKYFFFQTFMTMADSYKRATGEEEVTKKMQEFAREFAKESGISEEKEDDS